MRLWRRTNDDVDSTTILASSSFVLLKEPSEKSCVFSCLLVTAPFAFCVLTFEPIEVQSCSAPQNDRLNLSIVKGIYVDGKKLAMNGILAGGWRRLPIDDKYAALFW